MKLLRLSLAITLIVSLVGLAMVAESTAPVANKMADAATKFLTALSPELKKKASFPVDSPERMNWNFVPMQDRERNPTRKGVGIFEMNQAQRNAAMDLLRAGTSDKGFQQASTIMELEGILRELEKGGGSVRNPEWYFVTIFGEPSKTGKWGWRIEGHHLSVNFLIDNGEVVETTPLFYGANPAEIMTGDRKGERTLAAIEDLAFELIGSLNADQKAQAHRDEHFAEVKQQPKAEVGDPVGVTGAEFNEDQRGTLLKLMRAYANRLPERAAKVEMDRALKAGLEKVHFAYSGPGEKGKPITYRVQGPTFVIEFLNVQADSLRNPANHIHSVWRRLPTDF